MRAASFIPRFVARAASLLALLIASAAPPAGAQSTASAASADTPSAAASNDRATAGPARAAARIEYGLYVGEGYAGRRSFTTGTSSVAGKNWKQFAERLEAEPFPDYPSAEPAFFDWLAERGWELVECERREEIVGLLGDRDTVTRCYFRRAAGASAGSAPGDSLRGREPG